jgi:hypothetical protein
MFPDDKSTGAGSSAFPHPTAVTVIKAQAIAKTALRLFLFPTCPDIPPALCCLVIF